MESLKLDSGGDLVLENGELQVVGEKDELIQTFKILLQTNKNEWFLNPTMGFDYSVVLGAKEVNEEEIMVALHDVVDQMDEIDRFEELDIYFDRGKRKLTMEFKIITVDGEELEMKEVL